MDSSQRNVGIDLLRILLFLMIVIIHTFATVLSQSTHNDMSNSVLLLIYTISRPAVNVFILISGFFSFNKIKFEYKNLFLKTLNPILIYIPIIYIYSVAFSYQEIGLGKAIALNIYNIFTLDGPFFHLWYMVCYIVLFLLVPYINICIAETTKTQHIMLIVFSSLIFMVLSSINDFFGMQIIYGYTGLSFTQMGVFNFTTFFTMYFIGSYIGKYYPNIKVPLLFFFITSMVTYGLTILYSSHFTPYNLIKQVFLKEKIESGYKLYEGFLKYNNILVVLMAIFVFLCFSKLKLSKSMVITKIAGCVYGGYIIHVPVLSTVFKMFFKNASYPYYKTKTDSIFILISIAIITFILSLTTEFIRQKIFKKQICKN